MNPDFLIPVKVPQDFMECLVCNRDIVVVTPVIRKKDKIIRTEVVQGMYLMHVFIGVIRVCLSP